jgi:lysophospholipase L1-like esterase
MTVGRQTLFKWLTAVASVMVALLLSEAALRVLWTGRQIFAVSGTYRLSSDPRLGYELVPNAPDGDESISSAGLRDVEFAQLKPKDHFRIAVIGDSVAFGPRVRQGDAIPKVLERLLNDTRPGTAPRYEVLNFAVEGYNSKQIARRLETTVAGFQPDLVVYVYCLNDPEGWDDTLGPLVAKLGSEQRRLFESRLRHADSVLTTLRLYQVTMAALDRMRPDGPSEVSFIAPEGESAAFYGPLHAESSQAWMRTQRDLGEIASRVRSLGGRLVAVISPLLSNRDEFRSGRYPLRKVHAKVAEAFQSRGAPVLDLVPALERFSRSTDAEFAFDEFHYSVAGHQFVALTILDFLMKEQLIPHASATRVSSLALSDPELRAMAAWVR